MGKEESLPFQLNWCEILGELLVLVFCNPLIGFKLLEMEKIEAALGNGKRVE